MATRLRLILTLLAAFIWAGAAWAQAVSTSAYAPPGRYTVGQSRIPMILPSSGSMANNGALTLTTALDQTYPNAYFYMPASAIAAGSAAGFYYGVMSSTTAVTLYNNPYVSGTPTIPASPTAFVTTGPGSYTQTTAAFLTCYTITIPGGTLGIYDEVQARGNISYNNTAGAKTLNLDYGSFVYGAAAPTTTVSQAFQGGFANDSVANRQTIVATAAMTLTTAASAPANGAIDSTTSQTLTAQLKLATATDYLILQNLSLERIVAASN